MQTREAVAKARVLIAEVGVTSYRVVLDTRPTRRLGQTRYGVREIGLSAKWVRLAPWEEVRQVVLHEAAHALVGPGHGHDRVWKAQARRIGAPAKYSFATENAVPGNISIVCELCGPVGTMHRMPKRPFGRVHTACRHPVRFVRKG